MSSGRAGRRARGGRALGWLLGAAVAGLVLLLCNAPVRSRLASGPEAGERPASGSLVRGPVAESERPAEAGPPLAAREPRAQRAALPASAEAVEELLHFTLRYRVVDERGEPVVGARLGVDSSPEVRGSSDREGRGVLAGLAASAGVLDVRAWRRGSVSVPFDLERLGTALLPPAPGTRETLAELVVTLPTPPGLWVRVVDPTGAPVPGLTVEVEDAASAGTRPASFVRAQIPRRVTDAVGRVSLSPPEVHAGTVAQAQDLEVVVRGSSGARLLSERVTWFPGTAVQVELVAPATCTFHGRVLGPGGSPVSPASVHVGEAAFVARQGGTFETWNLRVPAADVLVTAPGYAPRFLAAVRLDTGVPLDVHLEPCRAVQLLVAWSSFPLPDLEAVARWRGAEVGRARRIGERAWLLEDLPFEPFTLVARVASSGAGAASYEVTLEVAADAALVELPEPPPREPAPESEPLPFPLNRQATLSGERIVRGGYR